MSHDSPGPASGAAVLVGWVERVRDLGHLAFLVLRTEDSREQVVVTRRDLVTVTRQLRPETLVELQATRAVGGATAGELHATAITRRSNPPPTLPFPVYRGSSAPRLNLGLEHPSLRLRRREEQLALRLQAAVLRLLRAALDGSGHVEIVTPKLGGQSEGGAEQFSTSYFGQRLFLTQSSQLYRQMLIPALGRVYEVATVFRASPSATSRHLSEYVAVETEWAPVEDHNTVLDTVANLLRHLFEDLVAEVPDLLEQLGVQLPRVPDRIPYARYEDVDRVLEQAEGCRRGPAPGEPFGTRVWSAIAAEHDSDFFALLSAFPDETNFYDYVEIGERPFVRRFQLWCRGLSIVCGGQRWHRLEDYRRALAEHQIPAEPLDSYLAVIGAGMPAHGGYSLALSRLLTAMCGYQNIRQVVMFPRDPKRLAP